MEKRRNLRPFLLLLFVSIILSLPVLIRGFWPFFFDANCHNVWNYNFSRQVWQGDIYPRWLANMNGGLGSPAFFYYPPVPYWITSVIDVFYGSASNGWHASGVSCCLSLFLSGCFAFIWLNEIVRSPRAALVGAICYQACPFHTAVDLFQRGAFSEFWGFTWLPLVIYFIRRLVIALIRPEAGNQGKISSFTGLVLSLALTLCTHMPTVLTFCWIPPAYALWLLLTIVNRNSFLREIWRPLVVTAAGFTLGIMLSAIYFIPALFMQKWVQINELVNDGYNYFNLFARPGLLIDNFWVRRIYTGIGVTWLYLAILIVAAAIVLRLYRRSVSPPEGDPSHKNSERSTLIEVMREAWFWGGVGTVAICMMLPLSDPIYHLVPKLRFIQFPYRFGVELCLAVTCVLACCAAIEQRVRPKTLETSDNDRQRLRHHRLIQVIVIQATIGFSCYIIWTTIQNAWPVMGQPPSPNMQLEQGFTDVPEYRPIGVTKPLGDIHKLFESKNGQKCKFRIVSGDASVNVEQWTPRAIILNIQSTSPSVVELNRWFFPGLRCENSDISMDAAPETGVVRLRVPALFTRRVLIRVHPVQQELAGFAFSLVGLLGCAAGCLLLRWAGWQRMVPFPHEIAEPVRLQNAPQVD